MPRAFRENTLPSFDAAISAGADGIELDVHATSDGVVVVHHDDEVPGAGAIAGLTWDVLRRAELGSGARIPTLNDVCVLAGDRVELFVEIKGAGIEGPVLDVLRAHSGRVAIHSFDHALIARIAASGSSCRLGLLLERETADVAALMREHGARDVWPHHSLATPQLVGAVHRAGGRAIAWTVNDRALASRLTSFHIDGLCTDDVRLLVAS